MAAQHPEHGWHPIAQWGLPRAPPGHHIQCLLFLVPTMGVGNGMRVAPGFLRGGVKPRHLPRFSRGGATGATAQNMSIISCFKKDHFYLN